MSTHYTVLSHGKVLGHTGALFPTDALPVGACIWHFVPMPAFEFVEPIIAELTAPPAIELVEEEGLHGVEDERRPDVDVALARHRRGVAVFGERRRPGRRLGRGDRRCARDERRCGSEQET